MEIGQRCCEWSRCCGKLTSLDLSKNQLDAEAAKVLGETVTVTPSLTVTDMRYNNLDTESATMLANIAKEKSISLCGITPGQTEADFTPSKNHYDEMKPADAILLTADLAVIPSLTSVR